MKFEKAIEKLTMNRLEFIAKNLPDVTNDKVYQSYSKLLQFSQASILNKTENTLIGIAHMAYGWMPTMLNYTEHKKDTDLFWQSITEGCLTLDFLEPIKESINNSIVGGSKFLHFVNPEDYAIFDSRVYKSIVGKKKYNYNVNACVNYVKYTEKLRSMRSGADNLKKILIQRDLATDETTLMRCMEMCLFYEKWKERNIL